MSAPIVSESAFPCKTSLLGKLWGSKANEQNSASKEYNELSFGFRALWCRPFHRFSHKIVRKDVGKGHYSRWCIVCLPSLDVGHKALCQQAILEVRSSPYLQRVVKEGTWIWTSKASLASQVYTRIKHPRTTDETCEKSWQTLLHSLDPCYLTATASVLFKPQYIVSSSSFVEKTHLVKDNSSLDGSLVLHRLQALRPLLQLEGLVDNPFHIHLATIKIINRGRCNLNPY